jgi:hypothetical protein
MRELILYDPSSAFDKKVKILIVIVNRLYLDKIERNGKLFTRLGEVQALRHDLAYSVLSLKDQPDISGAHGMGPVFHEDVIFPLLKKPFDTAELLAKIASIVGQ